MAKIIAYDVIGEDNGANYYIDAPRDVFCTDCGSVVDRGYTPRTLHLDKCVYDLSSTYDGHDITSQKFKDFCQRWKIPDLNFVKVNEAPSLYELRPRLILAVDVERSGVEFEDRCQTCGQYESVTGPPAPYLKDLREPIETGVFRTDIEFGGLKKGPSLIVGIKTKELMENEKLRGLVSFPVEFTQTTHDVTLVPINVGKARLQEIEDLISRSDPDVEISVSPAELDGDDPIRTDLVSKGESVIVYGTRPSTKAKSEEIRKLLEAEAAVGPVTMVPHPLEREHATHYFRPNGIGIYLLDTE